MSVDTYLTPSNTTIWIGDIKLDDAFRVDWTANNAKAPLYGWADKQYRAVADGRQIVTGRLIMNYRFPGYLYTAIQNARNTLTEVPGLREEREKLRQRLQTLRDGSAEAKAEVLMQTLQRGDLTEFHRYESLLRAIYDPDAQINQKNAFSSKPSSDKIISPYKIPMNRGPFDIKILYGSTNLHSYQIEKIIKGVFIVGESQTISGSATGGGDISSSGSPIYEIYNFMAREISEFVRQPQPRQQDLNDIPGYNGAVSNGILT